MTDKAPPASLNAGQSTGTVNGAPRWILRAEGLAVVMAAMALYAGTDASWWLFAALFLVPDLTMLGYLIDRKAGAHFYNMGHSYLGPAALIAFGSVGSADYAFAVSLIWFAHIGFDRAVGYGLKYTSGFHETHLGLPFRREREAHAPGFAPSTT